MSQTCLFQTGRYIEPNSADGEAKNSSLEQETDRFLIIALQRDGWHCHWSYATGNGNWKIYDNSDVIASKIYDNSDVIDISERSWRRRRSWAGDAPTHSSPPPKVLFEKIDN